MGRSFKHGRGRDRCGDTAVVELRTKLHDSERSYIHAQETEITSRSAYEEAATHFAEIGDERNGNPSEMEALSAQAEELRQEMARCSDESKISQHSASLRAIFDERDVLKDEIQEAERTATSRKHELANAIRKRKTTKRAFLAARQRHDSFFIERADVPYKLRDKVAVIVESRSGKTHVRASVEDMPDLCVTFRRDGSIVESTASSFKDFMIREYGDYMAAD